MYRDPAGQRLEVEIWGASAVTRIMPAIAGYRQRVGVAAAINDIPQQRDHHALKVTVVLRSIG